MKKIGILIILFLTLFCNITSASASSACSTEAVEELAKLLYVEFGGDVAKHPNDNFFAKLTTANVALNNASNRSGNTWKEKIYNLSDNQYQAHSSYKDKAFNQYVPESLRGELAYVSALVLSGKYSIPSNIIGQASCKCTLGKDSGLCDNVDPELEKYDCTGQGWAKEWTHVDTITGAFDTYFGYSIYSNGISNVTVFGETVKSTSVDYYKSLANSLKKNSYSEYTSSNVCSKVNNITYSENKGGNKDKNTSSTTIIDACTNPDILRVIYFFLIMLDIVKISIPIGLIVMGIIDFSKSVVISDEQVQKKAAKLFFKRILYGALVFAVPWIIEVLMVTLGNLTEGVNFTDCIENANSEAIERLEKELE